MAFKRICFHRNMKAYFTKKPMYTITHMQWLKITGIKKPNHVNMNSAVGESTAGEGIPYYLII
jgi:ribulose 1,5-bisphosphate carboxylase large subunit-like protein